MDSIFLGKFKCGADLLNVKVEETDTITTYSTYIGRDAAKNMEITDFVDLTNDDKCYICDQDLTSEKSFSLTNARTTATKTPVVSKLGELMGNSFVIVVSEKDYICQNCLKLFNRLDTIEKEANKLKAKAKLQMEQTYLSEGKETYVLSNKAYIAYLKSEKKNF